MSKFRSSCRMFATLSVAAVALGAMSAAVRAADASAARGADATAEKTRLDTFTAADGATYYALSLPAVTAPASDSHDMIILFNTSASQAGVYRDKSLEALGGLLATLGAKDRVQLIAVDLNAMPLTPWICRPARGRDRCGLAKLREPRAAGSHRLGRGSLESHRRLGGIQGAAKEVVYIGDGSSKANAMVGEFDGLVDRLVQKHISVSSYVIGQAVDATMLAALANQTGGSLAGRCRPARPIPSNPDDRAARSGEHLAEMATAPVFWPTSLAVSKSLAEVYPKHTPPLRGPIATRFYSASWAQPGRSK